MSEPTQFDLFTTIAIIVAVACTVLYLGCRAKPPRQSSAARTMATCMTFDLSQATSRYQMKAKVSTNEAKDVEREFRRFFALISLKSPAGCSACTARLWTSSGTSCCAARRSTGPTARRQSAISWTTTRTAAARGNYALTWAAYTATFDVEPDRRYWPEPVREEVEKAGVNRKKPSRSDNLNSSSSSGSGDDGGVAFWSLAFTGDASPTTTHSVSHDTGSHDSGSHSGGHSWRWP